MTSSVAGELAIPWPASQRVKGLSFAKDECKALVDDPVTAGFQIPAIMLQSLEHFAIEPGRELVPFFLGLLRNDYCP